MARIIKPAVKRKAERVFNTGDQVNWVTIDHDGRSYEHTPYTGKIVKVCKVNLHVEDAKGNIWEVAKEEIK